MACNGKFCRTFFVAVAILDTISGEVSDFAVGIFISLAVGVPEVVDRFIDVDIFNSHFSCAEGASVSDLFAIRWADANLSFYL